MPFMLMILSSSFLILCLNVLLCIPIKPFCLFCDNSFRMDVSCHCASFHHDRIYDCALAHKLQFPFCSTGWYHDHCYWRGLTGHFYLHNFSSRINISCRYKSEKLQGLSCLLCTSVIPDMITLGQH